MNNKRKLHIDIHSYLAIRKCLTDAVVYKKHISIYYEKGILTGQRNKEDPHPSMDRSGKCLTEEKEILSRWTEYCSELYNHENCGDNAVLDYSQPPEEDLQSILREEVESAVASLKKGKTAEVDNIPAELVQAGGETMIDVLTEICNKIWRTGEWPTPRTQSLTRQLTALPELQNYQPHQSFEQSHPESHLE